MNRVLLLAALLACPPVRAADAGDDPQVPVYIRRLGKEYAETYQRDAQNALRRVGAPAVSALIQTFSDSDPVRRVHAIEVLGDIREKRSLPFLLRLYQNETDVSLRCKVLEALGKSGDPALFSFMATQVQSRDPRLRAFAIWSLGELHDRRAVPYLLDIIYREQGYVVVTAIDALGKCGTPENARMLLEYLRYDDLQMRFVTARSLAEIGSEAIVPDLLEAVGKEVDPEVQEALVQAVGKAGGEAGIHALISLLKSSRAPNDQRLAEAGLQAAGLRAVFALTPLLENEDLMIQISAAKVLGAIRAPGVTASLLKMLAHRDPAVRTAALVALGQCGDRSVLKELVRFTENRDAGIRDAATGAVQAIAARQKVASPATDGGHP